MKLSNSKIYSNIGNNKSISFLIGIITIFLFIGFQTKKGENMDENKKYSFYLGTYTDSTSKGIYKFVLNEDGTIENIGLAAISDNPSFLAISNDRKFVIAANEINNNGFGTVETYQISGDSLEFVDRKSTGGAHPCFVAINNDGYVLTANYTGGNVGLLNMENNGKLSGVLDVQQHFGSGTTERQKAPHAHSVWFEQKSSNVISIDLGTNELFFAKLDTTSKKLLPLKDYKLNMEPGAGPRHLAFHPNNKWIYVANELDCTVTLVEKLDENYVKKESISTLPVGFSEPNTCADIHSSSDGKFIYVSNRGHNSIAIFSVNNDGSLKFVGHESTRGNGPRNFALSPDENYLLVANQKTRNIVSFKRNKQTGLLEFVSEIKAPTPVCILF